VQHSEIMSPVVARFRGTGSAEPVRGTGCIRLDVC
jgi:hypothetical protein